MDTTPEYIKMCARATEIQGAWKPTWGDYYLQIEIDEEEPLDLRDAELIRVEILSDSPSEEKDMCVSIDEKNSYITSLQDLIKHRGVWLPRQDQLQEMVKKPDDDTYSLSKRFLNFFVELDWHSSASLEQLWLAFVMKEKYNKVWDSEKEDWVNGHKQI